MQEVVIRIYGDSVSNPRYIQNVSLSEIWPELLRNKLSIMFPQKNILIFNRSVNGVAFSKIKDNAVWDENSCFYEGKTFLFVHAGIVDCAPRPIPDKVRNMVSKTPEFIKQRIIKFLHDNRRKLLKFRSYNVTPADKFKKYYKEILSGLNSYTVPVCFGIGPVSKSMCDRSYGLEDNIDEYNEIIKSLCGEYNALYIDTNACFRKVMADKNLTEDDVLLDDGHHYTKLGHELMSDFVVEIIKSKIGEY